MSNNDDERTKIDVVHKHLLGEYNHAIKKMDKLQESIPKMISHSSQEILNSTQYTINALREIASHVEEKLLESEKSNAEIASTIANLNQITDEYTKEQMAKHFEITKTKLETSIVYIVTSAIEKSISDKLVPIFQDIVLPIKNVIKELDRTAKIAQKRISEKKIPTYLLISAFVFVLSMGVFIGTWTQQRFWGTLQAEEQRLIYGGEFMDDLWPLLDEKTRKKYEGMVAEDRGE